MTNEQYLKNISVPEGKIDVVLDTDTYNEVDDQFAVSYMLAYPEKLEVKAIYAAPFFNTRSTSPEDGMEKSYDEILKLLSLTKKEHLKDVVFKGSRNYLADEKTPIESPASLDLVKRAKEYSPEKPLYVVAIGAITNVASALLLAPEIAENIVIVWLGGHATHWEHTREFNMFQDVAAARVVMGSAAPFVQLPCMGVVSSFMLPLCEIELYLGGKNAVGTFLAENVCHAVRHVDKDKAPSRVIWDATAIAWLVNDESKFLCSKIIPCPMPEYDNTYSYPENAKPITYIYHVERDALAGDMYKRIATL